MTPAPDSPLASFVVTCHNLGAYLVETLDSLSSQTDQNFEIIVVNDGSTDGATCRLLADLSFPRTRVVHSVRRGLPGARNFGVAHSAGQYLCMVDADDLLEPDYLARSRAVLDLQPNIAFASHWLRAFGDESWEWTPTDCGFPALLHANTLNGAALIRRKAFEAIGGFDESMRDGCEDWEFWIRTVAAGFQGVIIPEFLFRYRRRADSMSRRMQDVPGMAGLVRQIVDRHPAIFATHLTELLRRRDDEIASLSVSLWQLEETWAADVQGRLQWLRDNRAASPVEHEREKQRQRERELEERLETERVGLTVQLETTRNEVRRLHAAFSRERELNDALRASWSWRLSAPLRALASRLRR